MTVTKPMHHDPLRFRADDGDARSRVAVAVEALLEREPDQPRLRVVLDGDTLPSETIAGLIAGLRRLRERGGALEVIPQSEGIRDVLAVTGLDRIFALPLVPEESAPRHAAWSLRRLMRGFAGAFAAALVLVAAPSSADVTNPAPNDVHAMTLIRRVSERNPSLSSYQGRLHVDIAMSSFPFLHQHLDATAYYKKPSNYEVVFDRVPGYAKGFEKLFADVGDPSNWGTRFVVSEAGTAQFRGRKDVALRLVQRVRGQIDHETVLIDPAGATVDQIRYDYYNGGHITMTQTFTNVAGYTMLLGQEAEIAIPHVRATARGAYDDYKTNVAVDDAVFNKKKQ